MVFFHLLFIFLHVILGAPAGWGHNRVGKKAPPRYWWFCIGWFRVRGHVDGLFAMQFGALCVDRCVRATYVSRHNGHTQGQPAASKLFVSLQEGLASI